MKVLVCQETYWCQVRTDEVMYPLYRRAVDGRWERFSHGIWLSVQPYFWEELEKIWQEYRLTNPKRPFPDAWEGRGLEASLCNKIWEADHESKTHV